MSAQSIDQVLGPSRLTDRFDQTFSPGRDHELAILEDLEREALAGVLVARALAVLDVGREQVLERIVALFFTHVASRDVALKTHDHVRLAARRALQPAPPCL